jgi:hypothetical protein
LRCLFLACVVPSGSYACEVWGFRSFPLASHSHSNYMYIAGPQCWIPWPAVPACWPRLPVFAVGSPCACVLLSGWLRVAPVVSCLVSTGGVCVSTSGLCRCPFRLGRSMSYLRSLVVWGFLVAVCLSQGLPSFISNSMWPELRIRSSFRPVLPASPDNSQVPLPHCFVCLF